LGGLTRIKTNPDSRPVTHARRNFKSYLNRAPKHIPGSERATLAAVRPVLADIQQGRCFYRNKPLSLLSTHVDHFIAWSRYPIDLGHNFVLADNRCNGQKCDRLPAYYHLSAWTERNRRFGDQIGDAMKHRGIIAELMVSNRVAQWAYEQTESANGLTWLRADELEPLNPRWRMLFTVPEAPQLGNLEA
jgi:hypothetical protein